MNHEMDARTFTHPNKGCVDIDYKKVEPFLLKLLQSKGIEGKILRAWIHFMAPGSNHNSGHTHAKDIGVYYLQAPKNCGNLRFDGTNEIIEPAEGKFVIIPKLTVHSMAENKSDGVRLAMGFPFEVINQ